MADMFLPNYDRRKTVGDYLVVSLIEKRNKNQFDFSNVIGTFGMAMGASRRYKRRPCWVLTGHENELKALPVLMKCKAEWLNPTLADKHLRSFLGNSLKVVAIFNVPPEISQPDLSAVTMSASKPDLNALLAEADRREAVGAPNKVDPDSYRKEHGRCPKGWIYDPKGKKCIKDKRLEKQKPGKGPAKPVKKPVAPKQSAPVDPSVEVIPPDDQDESPPSAKEQETQKHARRLLPKVNFRAIGGTIKSLGNLYAGSPVIQQAAKHTATRVFRKDISKYLDAASAVNQIAQGHAPSDEQKKALIKVSIKVATAVAFAAMGPVGIMGRIGLWWACRKFSKKAVNKVIEMSSLYHSIMGGAVASVEMPEAQKKSMELVKEAFTKFGWSVEINEPRSVGDGAGLTVRPPVGTPNGSGYERFGITSEGHLVSVAPNLHGKASSICYKLYQKLKKTTGSFTTAEGPDDALMKQLRGTDPGESADAFAQLMSHNVFEQMKGLTDQDIQELAEEAKQEGSAPEA